MLSGLVLLIILFLVLFSMFIPIGNENSTVRRLPWITFGIMALNVLIYYVTLPGNVTPPARHSERGGQARRTS